MADEKILKDELLNDAELDNISGGTMLETYLDGKELYKRGLLTSLQAISSSPVINKLHELGYAGYQDKDGIISNIYTDKQGNTITREQFWKNFDAENGTKIIR